jgi:hypothetical protein
MARHASAVSGLRVPKAWATRCRLSVPNPTPHLRAPYEPVAGTVFDYNLGRNFKKEGIMSGNLSGLIKEAKRRLGSTRRLADHLRVTEKTVHDWLKKSDEELAHLRPDNIDAILQVALELGIRAEQVSPVHAISTAEVLDQVRKIRENSRFARSSVSQSLFEFLVRAALDRKPLSEAIIGREIWGPRAEGSTVRATIGRLRKSLADHYAEFPEDAITISIPKGTYVPKFTSTKLRQGNADYAEATRVLTTALGEDLSKAAFELFVDTSITATQMKSALTAIADFYRACGGSGLQLEFEAQSADVTERIDA